MAQHNKTYPESPLTSLKYTKHEPTVSKKAPKAASSPKPQAATNPEEVKRRRYTVFLRYGCYYYLLFTTLHWLN